jgi:hypothetical protein
MTEKQSTINFSGKVISRYRNPETGEIVPGSEQVDENMVVDTGAIELVKWLVNSSPQSAGAFKYMGLGTSTTAAAHGQTALIGELTGGTPTYTRIAGTQSAVNEVLYPANGAKVYQLDATFPATTATGSNAVGEYGLFNQLAAGGIMLVRAVFSPVRDNQNNVLEVIYQLTVAPQ